MGEVFLISILKDRGRKDGDFDERFKNRYRYRYKNPDTAECFPEFDDRVNAFLVKRVNYELP